MSKRAELLSNLALIVNDKACMVKRKLFQLIDVIYTVFGTMQTSFIVSEFDNQQTSLLQTTWQLLPVALTPPYI